MLKTIASNPFYEISVDTEQNLMYINLCGFWGGRANVPEYLNDCKTAASCMQPKFRILVDMTQIKTVSSEASLLHAEVQKIFMQAGMSQAAEVYRPQDPVVRHQLTCIKQSTGVDKLAKVFTDRTAAHTWLSHAATETKKPNLLDSLQTWFR
jgi:hypothetical protein